ncbi:hypothetical protein J6590_010692 [Homalodisca vitripennis]|nr:hypothetical protein J6590_010692 [Homalodisca vitripennis]
MGTCQGLLALLGPSYGLPINMKLLFYKTIVRPTITYSAPAWYSHISKSTRTALEAFQKRILLSTDEHTLTHQEHNLGHPKICRGLPPSTAESCHAESPSLGSSWTTHLSHMHE